MQYRAIGAGDVRALINTTGAAVEPAPTGYVTLGVATYLFPINQPEAIYHGIHLITDAVIAGTFTLEVNNQPATLGNMGQGVDIEDWRDTAAAGWVPFNSTTSYVNVMGTGFTPTVLSLAKLAGVGAAYYFIGPMAAKRFRLKAVIGTGGTVRVNHHAVA